MGLVELVWGVTTILTLLLIWLSATLYTIKQFFFSGRDENLEIHKWLRRTSLTYMCSYSMAYFFVLLLTGLALSSNKNFYNNGTLGWNLLFSLIILFGSIGFLSHYLFLSAQVYYSFKPTQYAMPERTMTIYICLCGVVAILLILYAVSYFLYKPLLIAALPIASIAVIINFFIAGSLVYFFTNRLTKCASARRETSTASRSALTPRQSNYVRIAAKHCLLGCIGISMFNIFIPFAIIFYVWVYPHDVNTYLLTVVICLSFHTIEMVSVLMTFAFNKQFYNKCCKICDDGCNKFLLHIAEKKLDDKTASRNKMRVNSTTTSTTQSRRVSNLSHTPNSTNTKSPAIGAIGTIDTLHRIQTQDSMATATIGSFDTMNISKFSNPTDDHIEDTQNYAPTLTNPPTHLSVHTASHDIFSKHE